MYKVDNFTLCFDVIADTYSYQQMVSPNPSNPLEKIFLDNIKKGNLSVTNPTVVKVLRDHLQTLVGDYYLIE